MTDATDRQKLVARSIHALTMSKGYAPNLNEVSKSCGCSSKGGAASAIEALVTKGYLTRQFNVPRSMVLTAKGLELVK